MAKVKYYYDADTLSYRKIERNKKGVFAKTIFSLLAIVLIAFFGFIGFSQFLMSPNERMQKREVDNLKLHFELLSKRMEESGEILNELQEETMPFIEFILRQVQFQRNKEKQVSEV